MKSNSFSLVKMPIKLKKIFEKEYMKKGYTKKEADDVFYGYEAKKKALARRKKR